MTAGFADEPLGVSMVSLLATPDAYHERWIRVIGFLNLEFEGNHLYLHEEDFRHSISRNSLWIYPPDDMSVAQQRRLSGNYVLAEGRFDARHHGHMGLSSGAIRDVNRLQLWSSRDDRRRRLRGG